MALKVERSTRESRFFAAFLALGLAALAALPYYAGPGAMRLVAEMAYYLALAQLWNLLAGYAGLVSVGQQAFVGIGGYSLYYLTSELDVHPLVALALAAPIAAAISLPMAFAVFRLRGAYFAVGTWVLAEIFALAVSLMQMLGAGSGMSLTPAIVRQIAPDRAGRELIVYWLALAIAAIVVAAAYLLLRSRHGLALTAIRDSEPASESLGVDTFRTKLMVYVVTAGCTGLVGAFIFLQKLRISPEAGFSVNDWTVVVIFMVVIGGIGTLEGPFVGMLVYFGLREALAQYGTWYLILLGMAAVAIMLLAQDGLWGLVARRFNLHLFPVRRHLARERDPTKSKQCVIARSEATKQWRQEISAHAGRGAMARPVPMLLRVEMDRDFERDLVGILGRRYRKGRRRDDHAARFLVEQRRAGRGDDVELIDMAGMVEQQLEHRDALEMETLGSHRRGRLAVALDARPERVEIGIAGLVLVAEDAIERRPDRGRAQRELGFGRLGRRRLERFRLLFGRRLEAVGDGRRDGGLGGFARRRGGRRRLGFGRSLGGARRGGGRLVRARLARRELLLLRLRLGRGRGRRRRRRQRDERHLDRGRLGRSFLAPAEQQPEGDGEVQQQCRRNRDARRTIRPCGRTVDPKGEIGFAHRARLAHLRHPRPCARP